MNWEVIFLDGKEGRPYRECKICRALKEIGEIEEKEVEPVVVFVPEGEKGKVLDILKGITPESLETKLKELYESWGVDNFERKIDQVFKNNTCETCIFHCEKRNGIWRENDKWNSNLLSVFQDRVDKKVNGAGTKCVFDFSIFPNVSFKGKVFPEKTRFIFSEFPGNSYFSGAKFKSVYFLGAKFENVNFSKAKFESADFSGAEFESANFIEAEFKSAYFLGAKFENVNFSKAKFESADFRGAKFESANFIEAEFKSAYFLGAKFENAYFRGAKFENAYFRGVKFENANFWEAKFESADFREAKFESAYFWKAKFESANFWRAEFESTNFIEAEFKSAYFLGAKFENVSFSKAKFESAGFWRAEFESAVKLIPIGNCFYFDFTKVKFGEKCEVLIRNLRSVFLFLNNIDNIPEKFKVYDLKILSPEEFMQWFRCGKEFKVKDKKARDRAKKVKNINRIKSSINESLRKVNSFLEDWKKKLHEYENRANLEIIDSDLGKMKFVNCDFSGAERIRIENSDLTDVRFLATDWGDINEKRICPELFEKEPKKARDIYRQLKLTLDNHKDFVSANGFYALEMKAQEKILEQSMGIYEKGEGILSKLKSFLKFPKLIWNCIKLSESSCELLVLKIHRISSNFGQSWVRPLLWLYFLSLLFSFGFYKNEWSKLFSSLNFEISNLRFTDFIVGFKVIGSKFLTALCIPLQMIAEITKVVKGEFKDSDPVVVASRLLYTVVAGFLIYQFGGAVRRRVKR